MFKFGKKGKEKPEDVPEEEKTPKKKNVPPAKMKSADAARLFAIKYAPYSVKDYAIKPREAEEFSKLDEVHPGLSAMGFAVEQKRAEDPYIGAKLAGKEILLNITNWLKNERGVQAEALLASLAAAGGRICQRELMKALEDMVSEDSPDRQELIFALAGLLGIYIADTKSGEKYILGDRIGGEFVLFFNTSLGEDSFFDTLKPISELTASLAGEEEYWDTPFDAVVGANPRRLADMFAEKFEPTFDVFCRFPQEKMLAAAFALQNAVREVTKQNTFEKDKAARIIAEFGWRTAHYIA